jgi:hypothetical protein
LLSCLRLHRPNLPQTPEGRRVDVDASH